MAAKRTYYGAGIFKYSRKGCKYLIEAEKNSNESEFDVCMSPVCIWKMRMRHTFLLRCPESQCVYIKKQDPKDIELIERYINKYAVDGFLFMTYKHKTKLCEKIRFAESSDQGKYLVSLLIHHGWLESITQDDLDKGVYYTCHKEKRVTEDLETLANRLKDNAAKSGKKKRKV